jgi:uncharacterized protein with PIN domain
LISTLVATGSIRRLVVDLDGGHVALSMAIKAHDRSAAQRAAAHLGRVAHRAAGLGDLDEAIACSAVPRPEPDPPA